MSLFDEDEVFGRESEEIDGLSMPLNSSDSTRISLETIRNGDAGLNPHRQSLLSRVPEQEGWASVKKETVTHKDIAYLSAYTGDEFALLTGKNEDILYHGTPFDCHIEKSETLMDLLLSHKFQLEIHSHPDYGKIVASANDRNFLKFIDQKRSKIISSYTGEIVEFTYDRFEII